MRAISITSKGYDGKDYGYFMGNNYNEPEKDCLVDPCDWGNDAEDIIEKLNKIFEENGWDLMASISIFDE